MSYEANFLGGKFPKKQKSNKANILICKILIRKCPKEQLSFNPFSIRFTVVCVTYELSVPEEKINSATPRLSPLKMKNLQTLVFGAIRNALRSTNWPSNPVLYTNTVSVVTNVNVIWTPPHFTMVLTAKFIANIVTPSILDTKQNLNIKAGWTLKLFKVRGYSVNQKFKNRTHQITIEILRFFKKLLKN